MKFSFLVRSEALFPEQVQWEAVQPVEEQRSVAVLPQELLEPLEPPALGLKPLLSDSANLAQAYQGSSCLLVVGDCLDP